MDTADFSQIHTQYQRTLLTLLRGDDAEESLSELLRLSLRLAELAQTRPGKAFWALVVRVLEGLDSTGEKPAAETLRLLGAVERSVKTWMLTGESCFASGDLNALASRLRDINTGRAGSEDELPISQDATTMSESEDPAGVPNVAALKATLMNLAEHPAWLSDEPEDATFDEAEPDSNDSAIEERPQVEVTEDISAGQRSARPEARATAGQVKPGPAGLAPFVLPGASAKRDDGSARSPTPLTRSDTVPISNTYPRLKWVARESCQALGRQAHIRNEGDGKIDRRLLKRMLGPLECLIRNAIYYGIEGRDDRLEAGKSPAGRIDLTFHHGKDSRSLTIETDGLAVDPERILRKAEALGLLLDSEQPSRSQLLELMLAEGFSTAHVATQTAGYGIGLYAATQELEASGCTLRLSPSRRDGLRFTVRLPD